MLEECIRKFSEQVYPNKEIIIVVNTSDFDLEAARARLQPDDPIQIYQLHEEKNVGACLNFAAQMGKGDYLAKMDDDDFYGPYYLTDMMLPFRFLNIDLVGKPQFFFYFEEKRGIYERSIGRERENRLIIGRHATGASLFFTRKLWQKNKFSETIRAAVDSNFMQYVIDRKVPIFFGDRFNFVVFRSANRYFHTWMQGNDSLFPCRYFCDFEHMKDVMI